MKLTTRFLLALAGAAVISLCHGTSQAAERSTSSTKVDYSAEAAELLGAMDRAGVNKQPRSNAAICKEAFDAAQKGDKDMTQFHDKHCAYHPEPGSYEARVYRSQCYHFYLLGQAGDADAQRMFNTMARRRQCNG